MKFLSRQSLIPLQKKSNGSNVKRQSASLPLGNTERWSFSLYRRKKRILVVLFVLVQVLLIRHLYSSDNTSAFFNSAAVKSSLRESITFFQRVSFSQESQPVQVALIFDKGRIKNALAAVRSVNFFRRNRTDVPLFHLVAPLELHAEIRASLPGYSVKLYDYELCRSKTRYLMPFSNPKIHTSAHCKVFLADILVDVDRVLYIDTDMIATNDISPCYHAAPPESQADEALLGMVVDMGDVCQLDASKCWPIGFEWLVPDGTICGNIPRRYNGKRANSSHYCPAPLARETYQLNGGVLNLHLGGMRKRRFIEDLAAFVVKRARAINFKLAQWGEQDFLNSYFKEVPQVVYPMPCGCNYQFTGTRREVKCPRQPIYLDHSWSQAASRRTSHPLSQMAFMFQNATRFGAKAHHTDGVVAFPKFENITSGDETASNYSLGINPMTGAPNFRHAADCKLQDYAGCNVSLSTLPRSAYGEPVIVLSKPNSPYRAAFENSIAQQVYVEPLVIFGNSSFGEYNGWILLMDQAFSLMEPHNVAHLMASVSDKTKVYFWSTVMLPPNSPTISQASDPRWPGTAIALVHSSVFSNLRDSWEGKAAEFNSMLAKLPGQFIAKQLTSVHPLHSSPGSKVTVIITSVGAEAGFRLQWLKESIKYLASDSMRYLIDQVIVVWNSPNRTFDLDLGNSFNHVRVLPMTRNSLNNRWTETLPHIRTDAVLNFDDDVLITESAILCLFGYFQSQPLRPVGPFVRRHDPQTKSYYMDEILNGQNFSIVLPRVLMLHRKYLEDYNATLPMEVKAFVDSQKGHCDDIALNTLFAARNVTSLRVILPPESLLDFFSSCYSQYPAETGGLALVKNRETLRSECLSYIISRNNSEPLFSNEVATCARQGALLGSSSRGVSPSQFKSMRKHVACTLSGK